jgi:hypothetical protein
MARHEAALEQAEANRKARLELQEQISRQVRDREVADLRFQSAQQQAWQRNVENATRNAIAYQHQQTLMGELERMLSPPAPPPPPEPEVVYVADDELGSPNIADENYNPRYWLDKPIFRR